MYGESRTCASKATTDRDSLFLAQPRRWHSPRESDRSRNSACAGASMPSASAQSAARADQRPRSSGRGLAQRCPSDVRNSEGDPAGGSRPCGGSGGLAPATSGRGVQRPLAPTRSCRRRAHSGDAAGGGRQHRVARVRTRAQCCAGITRDEGEGSATRGSPTARTASCDRLSRGTSSRAGCESSETSTVMISRTSTATKLGDFFITTSSTPRRSSWRRHAIASKTSTHPSEQAGDHFGRWSTPREPAVSTRIASETLPASSNA